MNKYYLLIKILILFTLLGCAVKKVSYTKTTVKQVIYEKDTLK